MRIDDESIRRITQIVEDEGLPGSGTIAVRSIGLDRPSGSVFLLHERGASLTARDVMFPDQPAANSFKTSSNQTGRVEMRVEVVSLESQLDGNAGDNALGRSVGSVDASGAQRSGDCVGRCRCGCG